MKIIAYMVLYYNTTCMIETLSIPRLYTWSTNPGLTWWNIYSNVYLLQSIHKQIMFYFLIHVGYDHHPHIHKWFLVH